MKKLKNLSVAKQLNIIRKEPTAIKFFKNPDVQVQLEAISIYSNAVEFIEGEVADEAKVLAIIKNSNFHYFTDQVEHGLLAKSYGFYSRFKSNLLGSLNRKTDIRCAEEFIMLQQAICRLLIGRYPLLVKYLQN